MQSIEQIQSAVVAAFPNATLAEQGKVIAAIIEQMSATIPASEPTQAPARKARTRKAQPKAVATKAQPQSRKPQPKTVKSNDNDWRDRPASKKQLARITAVSDEHGFEVYDMTGWTAGVASDYYQALRAEITA
jgi:hypothetical protein